MMAWECGGGLGLPAVTSGIVVADAPNITHLLIFILLLVSCLACGGVGSFLGRESLYVL